MRWSHALSGVALAAGSLACSDEPLPTARGRDAGVDAAGSGGGGVDAGAPLWACPQVETKPDALVSPDPRRSVAGAVAVVTAPLLEGIPLAGWSVDGAARPPPGPTHPYAVLDTRLLDDGVHTLGLDVVEADQSMHHVETDLCVANGPAPAPDFTGAFVDVTGESGLGALAQTPSGSGAATLVAGAVAADFDGDGDLDLFAWNADGGRVFDRVGPVELVAKGATIPGVFTAGAADLDGDGDPDVVAAGVGLTLLRNDAGTLVDATFEGVLSHPIGPHAFRAITFADVDEDGLLDVALTQLDCDEGGPRFVLRNEGDLHFADVAPELGLADPMGGGYGTSIDSVGSDGALHVVRFTEGCRPGASEHLRLVPGHDLPVAFGLAPSPFWRVPPMGTVWLDADGDGELDLWIAGDVTSPATLAPGFDANAAPSLGVDAFVDSNENPVSAWSMAVLDADLDGRTDVFVVHHPSDPAFGPESSSRDALFWQRETGALRDVAGAAGLGGVHACRAVHPVDFDADGDTDLVVGCVDGVRLLRNDLVDPSPGRTIVLHGVVSNADGVHAILTSPSGERRLSRGGGQPYAGGVARESVRAPSGRLTVSWPSGIEQEVDAGSAPVLDVTEPDALRVTPRRIQAGSGETVAVEVRPAALGAPSAEVAVDASAGTWLEPPGPDPDGVWRGTLAPPSTPSTVVLTVRIGSERLRVRPRVFVR